MHSQDTYAKYIYIWRERCLKRRLVKTFTKITSLKSSSQCKILFSCMRSVWHESSGFCGCSTDRVRILPTILFGNKPTFMPEECSAHVWCLISGYKPCSTQFRWWRSGSPQCYHLSYAKFLILKRVFLSQLNPIWLPCIYGCIIENLHIISKHFDEHHYTPPNKVGW